MCREEWKKIVVVVEVCGREDDQTRVRERRALETLLAYGSVCLQYTQDKAQLPQTSNAYRSIWASAATAHSASKWHW